MKKEATDIESLEKIILISHSYEELHDAMRERNWQLNENFVFTDKTLGIFLALNDEFLQKMHDAYDKVQRIKLDFDQMIDSGKSDYTDYLISGEVELICKTNPLIEKLTYESNNFFYVSANDFQAMTDRNEVLGLKINWDYEMFPKKGLTQDSHYICFLTHNLFVDNNVLSLQDLNQLDEYEVVVNINIDL